MTVLAGRVSDAPEVTGGPLGNRPAGRRCRWPVSS